MDRRHPRGRAAWIQPDLAGLEKDRAATIAGLSLPYSNGPDRRREPTRHARGVRPTVTARRGNRLLRGCQTSLMICRVCLQRVERLSSTSSAV